MQALGYFGLIDLLHNCLFISIPIFLIQAAPFAPLESNYIDCFTNSWLIIKDWIICCDVNYTSTPTGNIET